MTFKLAPDVTATGAPGGTVRQVLVGAVLALVAPLPISTNAAPSVPPAPTGVAAAESYGDLTVAWNAVTGATGYEVLIEDITSGQTAFSQASWTQDPASDTPLADIDFSDFSAGDEYAFEVVAQDSSGNSQPSAQATVIAVGIPYSVFQGAGDGSAFFGWQDQPGATSYQVVQFDNCNFDYSSPIQVTAQQQQITNSDGTTSTWVQLTGLTDGQCYDYLVDAYNSTDGNYVAAVSGDIQLQPLGTPAWNPATTAGDGSAQLVWSTVTGATDYEIYMANQTTDAGDYSDVQSVTPGSGATQSAQVTGLTNGDTYSFYIIADNDFDGQTATGTQSLTPTATSSSSTVTGSVALLNHGDSSNNGHWANDDLTVNMTLTNEGPVAVSNCTAEPSAAQCYLYNGTIVRTGTFSTLTTYNSPALGFPVSLNAPLTGNVSGTATVQFYYSSADADPNNLPTSPIDENDAVYSSPAGVAYTLQWFFAGASLTSPGVITLPLSQVTVTGYDWEYGPTTATCETWSDSSVNSDGSVAPFGTDITGTNACFS